MVTSRVRLTEPLGAGGMGSVWHADHLSLDTQVAVKFISDQARQDDPTLSSRFTREANLAAKLNHPHVVQVFDHGLMDDGTPFIVMERLEGTSLRDHLKSSGRLSLRKTALLVSQLADVLAQAHKIGIIHRDIKPANIFLV